VDFGLESISDSNISDNGVAGIVAGELILTNSRVNDNDGAGVAQGDFDATITNNQVDGNGANDQRRHRPVPGVFSHREQHGQPEWRPWHDRP
jgi:hypothetical protein